MSDIVTELDADAAPDTREPGLPRLVCETHARLGPQATPEQVAEELRTHGIDTCVEDVKACWPESGKLSG